MQSLEQTPQLVDRGNQSNTEKRHRQSKIQPYETAVDSHGLAVGILLMYPLASLRLRTDHLPPEYVHPRLEVCPGVNDETYRIVEKNECYQRPKREKASTIEGKAERMKVLDLHTWEPSQDYQSASYSHQITTVDHRSVGRDCMNFYSVIHGPISARRYSAVNVN